MLNMSKTITHCLMAAAGLGALVAPATALLAQAPPMTVMGTLTPAPKVTSPRLYVLDCGQLIFNNPESYNLDRQKVPDTNMPVTCFLVVHPKGVLLFDTGLEDELVGRPVWEHIIRGYGQLKTTTLISQLADIGLSPKDITYLALSHSHFDHAGNARFFTSSTWLTPQAEYDFMFSEENRIKNGDIVVPGELEPLKMAKKVIIDKDYDVFGDGTVVLLQTPGHTPGHQSLYVNLKNTGGVVVSGDLYHYTEEKTYHEMQDVEKVTQTPASRKKVDDFLAKTHSQLWIDHSTSFYRGARKSPGFYD